MPIYKDKKRKTYYFRVRYKDVYGRSQQKLKRGFEKRQDAVLAEAEFLANAAKQYSDNATFDEIFEHNIKHTKLKDKTIRRRTNEYNYHIKPKFGHIKVRNTTLEQVLEFKTHLETTMESLNSARTVYSNFKVLINHAIKFFGLKVDPTLAAGSIQRVRPNINFIRREDFDHRVNGLEHLHYQELTRLLFYTGLRVGEGLALKWSDMNFEENLLHVNKTIDLATRKITTTKTKGSVGYVPFPAFIGEMLERIKKESAEKIYGFNNDMFVFGVVAPYHYS
ncbi:Arm DNA-binding domain-containing protein, partial [Paenibacillus polymyxa]|uniref:site-specific integrase n=1 Tax=Paenibacillus polymyxa TaxID=1406 RepID=UPI000472264E